MFVSGKPSNAAVFKALVIGEDTTNSALVNFLECALLRLGPSKSNRDQ